MTVINTFISPNGALRRQAPTASVTAPRTASASALAAQFSELTNSMAPGIPASQVASRGAKLARNVPWACTQSPVSDQIKLFQEARRFAVKLACHPGTAVGNALHLLWAADAAQNEPMNIAA